MDGGGGGGDRRQQSLSSGRYASHDDLEGGTAYEGGDATAVRLSRTHSSPGSLVDDTDLSGGVPDSARYGRCRICLEGFASNDMEVRTDVFPGAPRVVTFLPPFSCITPPPVAACSPSSPFFRGGHTLASLNS